MKTNGKIQCYFTSGFILCICLIPAIIMILNFVVWNAAVDDDYYYDVSGYYNSYYNSYY